MYKIVFYEDVHGNCPVGDFIQELNEKAETDKRARVLLEQIRYCLKRIEISGTRSGPRFTKRITGDIWELRPGNQRIFFFGWDGNHLVMLHNFEKKTQKTPQREIDKAQSKMADWIDRHK